MDIHKANLTQNFNNSNKSFSLSLKKRKKLWLRTLNSGNESPCHKTMSLNSNNRGCRISEIHQRKDSMKKKRRILRKSVTLSNVNISNTNNDRYPTYRQMFLDQKDEYTSYDASSHRKFDKTKLLKKSNNLLSKQKEFKDGIQGILQMEGPSKRCDTNTVADRKVARIYSINSERKKAESEIVLKKASPNSNLLYRHQQFADKIRSSYGDVRFNEFFDYLDNKKSVDENKTNVKKVDEVSIDQEKNVKQHRGKNILHLIENDEENTIKLCTLPLLNEHRREFDNKKLDLTYDDKYLYGSFNEGVDPLEEDALNGIVNFHPPLFPESQTDDGNKEHGKKKQNTDSDKTIIIDLGGKAAHYLKNIEDKTESKCAMEEHVDYTGLRFSVIKEFEDEFYNKPKYLSNHSRKGEKIVVKESLDNAIEKDVFDLKLSIDLDDCEPIELIEKDDCKESKNEKEVNVVVEKNTETDNRLCFNDMINTMVAVAEEEGLELISSQIFEVLLEESKTNINDIKQHSKFKGSVMIEMDRENVTKYDGDGAEIREKEVKQDPLTGEIRMQRKYRNMESNCPIGDEKCSLVDGINLKKEEQEIEEEELDFEEITMLATRNSRCSQYLSKEHSLDSNELIEAISKVTTPWQSSSDHISQNLRLHNQPLQDECSEKTEDMQNIFMIDDYDLNKSSLRRRSSDTKFELRSNHNVRSHAHVEVSSIKSPQSSDKSVHKRSMSSKYPICSLSSCLVSSKKPRICVKKTTAKSNHGGKRRDNLPNSMKSFLKTNFRQPTVSKDIYRCNELLLHSRKLSRPVPCDRSIKNNVSTNTMKNAFWCMPYEDKLTTMAKEKKSLTFSYKFNCTECQGKSLQTFQLKPQSPPGDVLMGSDNSTKTQPAEPYGYDDKIRKGGYGDEFQDLFMKVKNERLVKSYDKEYIIIENGLRRLQKDFLRPQVFEIQNTCEEFEKSNRENENNSIYLDIEGGSKRQSLNVDSIRPDLITIDNNTVFVLQRSTSGEGDINFLKNVVHLNKSNDDQSSSKIAEMNENNGVSVIRKYESIVFDSDALPSRVSPDEPVCEIREMSVSDSFDEMRKILSTRHLIPGTNIIDMDKYSSSFYRKKCSRTLFENSESKSTRQEYCDTVDLDIVVQDTYSVYSPATDVGKKDNRRVPTVVDSNFTECYHQFKCCNPESEDHVHTKIDPPSTMKECPTITSHCSYRQQPSCCCNYQNVEEPSQQPLTTESLCNDEHVDVAASRYNDSTELKSEAVNYDEQKTYNESLQSMPMINGDLISNNTVYTHVIPNSRIPEEIRAESLPSETLSNVVHAELLESSTEVNTERKIIKETSRALKVKNFVFIDPNDLLISSYEQATVNNQLGTKNVEDIVLTCKEIQIGSRTVEYNSLIEQNVDEIRPPQINDQSSSIMAQSREIPNKIDKEFKSLHFDSYRESKFPSESISFLDSKSFNLVDNYMQHFLLVDCIETLIGYDNLSYLENKSSEECTKIGDTVKEAVDSPGDNDSNFGCYFCQCQISRNKYEEHLKWCTETQKNLINESNLRPGNKGKNCAIKTLSATTGTVCFICGCYFTKHSLSIHEIACRKKWITWNEQLPRGKRKPIPEKPFFSEETIRENYEQEKNRGNTKFKLMDAVNKLIYEASLKNH